MNFEGLGYLLRWNASSQAPAMGGRGRGSLEKSSEGVGSLSKIWWVKIFYISLIVSTGDLLVSYYQELVGIHGKLGAIVQMKTLSNASH